MNHYKKHQELIQKFKRLSLSVIPELRLFDRHVGLFYTKNGHPIMISIPGQADVWGIYKSIHIELEFKSGKAIQTKEQKMWESFCKNNGMVYFLVRHEDDIYEFKKIIAQKNINFTI